jgi:hypothetical protein
MQLNESSNKAMKRRPVKKHWAGLANARLLLRRYMYRNFRA